MKCNHCERTVPRDASFCSYCGRTIMIVDRCNLCGESCRLGEGGQFGPRGLIDQRVSGGYESTPGNGHGALDDCTTYTFSLCEFCLDWLFTQFKVPVAVSGMMGLESETFRLAAERVASDEWRNMKVVFMNEHNRRMIVRSR